MSAKRNSTVNAITRSEVEPLPTVRWHAMAPFFFANACTSVRETYGNSVDVAVPVVAASSVSGLVKDYEDCNFGNIP